MRSPPPMRHFIIKISKLKDKERMKNSERKTICCVQGNPWKTVRFFSRNFADQKGAVRCIERKRKKEKLSGIFYMANLSFEIEGEIKNFLEKQKLKSFIKNIPTNLQGNVKGSS